MSSEQTRILVRVIRGDTKVVGVFGWPVEHSLSPAMHNAAFIALGMPYIYIPFPVRPDAIGTAIRSLPSLGIVGINLTIPHKETVMPFLDEITQEAKEIGAVNTVHCVDGQLLGDNTDGRGFYQPLETMGFRAYGKLAVVIGAGGAARSVVYRLIKSGARVILSNRTKARAEQLAQDVYNAGYSHEKIEIVADGDIQRLSRAIKDADLLVQTTRVGMYPNANEMPSIPMESIHREMIVYDLIYNPLKSRLLQAAELHGCSTISGVQMLVTQGAFAFERWTGVWPPTDVMEAAVVESLTK